MSQRGKAKRNQNCNLIQHILDFVGETFFEVTVKVYVLSTEAQYARAQVKHLLENKPKQSGVAHYHFEKTEELPKLNPSGIGYND